MNYHLFLFSSVKGQNIFDKFGCTDLKISLNIHFILLTFIHEMLTINHLSRAVLSQELFLRGKVFHESFWKNVDDYAGLTIGSICVALPQVVILGAMQHK